MKYIERNMKYLIRCAKLEANYFELESFLIVFLKNLNLTFLPLDSVIPVLIHFHIEKEIGFRGKMASEAVYCRRPR